MQSVQVSQFLFVIVSGYGGLEIDIGRKIVYAELLQVFCISVAFYVFERAERLGIGRIVVGEVPAVIFCCFIDRFRVLDIIFAV